MHFKTPRILKMVAMMTAVIFTLESSLWSAPNSAPYAVSTFKNSTIAKSFDIPAHLGQVQHRYVSDSDSFIVQIQDAHGQPDAQRNIRNLLQYVTKEHDARIVAVESAFAKIEPELLDIFTDDETNKKFINSLLQLGEVTGVELFAYENKDSKIEVVGAEDPELYRKSLLLYQKIQNSESLWRASFENYQKVIEQLRMKIFQGELQEYFLKQSEWRKQRESSLDYLMLINDYAKKHLDVDFEDSRQQFEWPALVRLAAIKNLESNINLELAKKDREAIVKSIESSQIGKEQKHYFKERLILLLDGDVEISSSLFKNSEFPHVKSLRQFFELLHQQAKQDIEFLKYPYFLDYLGSLILREELDSSKLLKELDEIEKQIQLSLIKTKGEKEVLELSQSLNLIEKLLSLELTREDFLNFKTEGLDAGSFYEKVLSFEKAFEKGISLRKLPQSIFQEAVEFYHLSLRRDTTLIEKTLSHFEKEKSHHPVILVTGGFHSDGIATELENRKISHVSISPKMTEVADEVIYKNAMLGKNMPYEVGTIGKVLFSQSESSYRLSPIMPSQRELILVSALQNFLAGEGKQLQLSDVVDQLQLAFERASLNPFEINLDPSGERLEIELTIEGEARRFVIAERGQKRREPVVVNERSELRQQAFELLGESRGHQWEDIRIVSFGSDYKSQAEFAGMIDELNETDSYDGKIALIGSKKNDWLESLITPEVDGIFKTTTVFPEDFIRNDHYDIKSLASVGWFEPTDDGSTNMAINDFLKFASLDLDFVHIAGTEDEFATNAQATRALTSFLYYYFSSHQGKKTISILNSLNISNNGDFLRRNILATAEEVIPPDVRLKFQRWLDPYYDVEEDSLLYYARKVLGWFGHLFNRLMFLLNQTWRLHQGVHFYSTISNRLINDSDQDNEITIAEPISKEAPRFIIADKDYQLNIPFQALPGVNVTRKAKRFSDEDVLNATGVQAVLTALSIYASVSDAPYLHNLAFKPLIDQYIKKLIENDIMPSLSASSLSEEKLDRALSGVLERIDNEHLKLRSDQVSTDAMDKVRKHLLPLVIQRKEEASPLLAFTFALAFYHLAKNSPEKLRARNENELIPEELDRLHSWQGLSADHVERVINQILENRSYWEGHSLKQIEPFSNHVNRFFYQLYSGESRGAVLREALTTRSEFRLELEDSVKALLDHIPDDNYGTRIRSTVDWLIKQKNKTLENFYRIDSANRSEKGPFLSTKTESVDAPYRRIYSIENIANEAFNIRRISDPELPLLHKLVFALTVFDSIHFPEVHEAILNFVKIHDVEDLARRNLIETEEYVELVRAYSEAERTMKASQNVLFRYAMNDLVLGISRSHRLAMEREYNANQMMKELDQPGTGDIPTVIFLTDWHGATRIGFLIAKALGIEDYNGIFSVQEMERRLIAQWRKDNPTEGDRQITVDEIMDEKNIIIVGGSDYVDRGPKPYWGFLFNKWLRKHGKLRFINGNHDIWKDWNIVGFHLIVNDELEKIARSGRFTEDDIEDHLKNIDRFFTTPTWTRDMDQIFAKYNVSIEDQGKIKQRAYISSKKVRTEEEEGRLGEVDQILAKYDLLQEDAKALGDLEEKFTELEKSKRTILSEFLNIKRKRDITESDIKLFADRIIDSAENANHSLEWWAREWGVHGGWFDTFLDHINEDVINSVISNANQSYVNLSEAQRNKLRDYLENPDSIPTTLRAEILPFREELLNNLSGDEQALFSTFDVSEFLENEEVGKIKQKIKDVRARNLEARTNYEIAVANGEAATLTQEEVPSPIEVTSRLAQEYVEKIQNQVGWLNRLIPEYEAVSLDAEVVTQENYRQNPLVAETALWDMKNARLVYVDVYNNPYTHGILPIIPETHDINVEYETPKGNFISGIDAIERMQYDIRRFFDEYEEVEDNPRFRKRMEEKLRNAMLILVNWYSDRTAELKPGKLGSFLQEGGPGAFTFDGKRSSIYNDRVFDPANGVWHVGHLDRGKIRKINVDYWVGGIVAALLHGDYDASEGYTGLGAYIAWMAKEKDGTRAGVRRYGYAITTSSLDKAIKGLKDKQKTMQGEIDAEDKPDGFDMEAWRHAVNVALPREIENLEKRKIEVAESGEEIVDITFEDDISEKQIENIRHYHSGENLMTYKVEQFLTDNIQTYESLIATAPNFGREQRLPYFKRKLREAKEQLENFRKKRIYTLVNRTQGFQADVDAHFTQTLKLVNTNKYEEALLEASKGLEKAIAIAEVADDVNLVSTITEIKALHGFVESLARNELRNEEASATQRAELRIVEYPNEGFWKNPIENVEMISESPLPENGVIELVKVNHTEKAWDRNKQDSYYYSEGNLSEEAKQYILAPHKRVVGLVLKEKNAATIEWAQSQNVPVVIIPTINVVTVSGPIRNPKRYMDWQKGVLFDPFDDRATEVLVDYFGVEIKELTNEERSNLEKFESFFISLHETRAVTFEEGWLSLTVDGDARGTRGEIIKEILMDFDEPLQMIDRLVKTSIFSPEFTEIPENERTQHDPEKRANFKVNHRTLTVLGALLKTVEKSSGVLNTEKQQKINDIQKLGFQHFDAIYRAGQNPDISEASVDVLRYTGVHGLNDLIFFAAPILGDAISSAAIRALSDNPNAIAALVQRIAQDEDTKSKQYLVNVFDKIADRNYETLKLFTPGNEDKVDEIESILDGYIPGGKEWIESTFFMSSDNKRMGSILSNRIARLRSFKEQFSQSEFQKLLNDWGLSGVSKWALSKNLDRDIVLLKRLIEIDTSANGVSVFVQVIEDVQSQSDPTFVRDVLYLLLEGGVFNDSGIVSLLKIIQKDPYNSKDLISFLIVLFNLRLYSFAENKFIQEEISHLLNSNIRDIYALGRTLALSIPHATSTGQNLETVIRGLSAKLDKEFDEKHDVIRIVRLQLHREAHTSDEHLLKRIFDLYLQYYHPRESERRMSDSFMRNHLADVVKKTSIDRVIKGIRTSEGKEIAKILWKQLEFANAVEMGVDYFDEELTDWAGIDDELKETKAFYIASKLMELMHEIKPRYAVDMRRVKSLAPEALEAENNGDYLESLKIINRKRKLIKEGLFDDMGGTVSPNMHFHNKRHQFDEEGYVGFGFWATYNEWRFDRFQNDRVLEAYGIKLYEKFFEQWRGEGGQRSKIKAWAKQQRQLKLSSVKTVTEKSGVETDEKVQLLDDAARLPLLESLDAISDLVEHLEYNGYSQLKLKHLMSILANHDGLDVQQISNILSMIKEEVGKISDSFRANYSEFPRRLAISLNGDDFVPRYQKSLGQEDLSKEQWAEWVEETLLSDIQAKERGLNLLNEALNDLLHVIQTDLYENRREFVSEVDPSIPFSLYHPPSAYSIKDENAILLGFKGYNLKEMDQLGVRVPAFVTMSSHIEEFTELDYRNPMVRKIVLNAIFYLERKTGKAFPFQLSPSLSVAERDWVSETRDQNGLDEDKDPILLLSARSGSFISMPGMMDSILNLPLTQDVLEQWLEDKQVSPRFAYDSYRRFLKEYASAHYGIHTAEFSELFDQVKEKVALKKGKSIDAVTANKDFGVEELQDVIELYQNRILQEDPDFLNEEPFNLLMKAVVDIYKSWNSEGALNYRKRSSISSRFKTAVNIQEMIFGNQNVESGTAVIESSDPSRGFRIPEGAIKFGAQGTDVVDGTSRTWLLSEIKDDHPDLYAEIVEGTKKLERHFGSPQDIELTWVKKADGKYEVFWLQTRDTVSNSKHPRRILDLKEVSLEMIAGRGQAVSPNAALGRLIDARRKNRDELIDEIKELRSWMDNTAGEKHLDIILIYEWLTNDHASALLEVINQGGFGVKGLMVTKSATSSHASLISRKEGFALVSDIDTLDLNTDGIVSLGGEEIEMGIYGPIVAIDGYPKVGSDITSAFSGMVLWAEPTTPTKIIQPKSIVPSERKRNELRSEEEQVVRSELRSMTPTENDKVITNYSYEGVVIEERENTQGQKYFLSRSLKEKLDIEDEWAVQQHFRNLYNALTEIAKIETLNFNSGQEIQVYDEPYNLYRENKSGQKNVEIIDVSRSENGFISQIDLFRLLAKMRGKALIQPYQKVKSKTSLKPAHQIALLVNPKRSNLEPALIRALLGRNDFSLKVVLGVSASQFNAILSSSKYRKFLKPDQIDFNDEEGWVEILGKRIRVEASAQGIKDEWENLGIQTVVSTYNAEEYADRLADLLDSDYVSIKDLRFLSVDDLDAFGSRGPPEEPRANYDAYVTTLQQDREMLDEKRIVLSTPIRDVPALFHREFSNNRYLKSLIPTYSFNFLLSPFADQSVLDQSGRQPSSLLSTIRAPREWKKFLRKIFRTSLVSDKDAKLIVSEVDVATTNVQVGDMVKIKMAFDNGQTESFIQNFSTRKSDELENADLDDLEEELRTNFLKKFIDKLEGENFTIKYAYREIKQADARFEQKIMIDRSLVDVTVSRSTDGSLKVDVKVPLVFNRDWQNVNHVLKTLATIAEDEQRNLPNKPSVENLQRSVYGLDVARARQQDTLPPARYQIPERIEQLTHRPLRVGLVAPHGQIGVPTVRQFIDHLNVALIAATGSRNASEIVSAIESESVQGPFIVNGSQIFVEANMIQDSKEDSKIAELQFGEGNAVALLGRKADPTQIPWSKYDIDWVVETSGAFVDPTDEKNLLGHTMSGRGNHTGAVGALLSAPFKIVKDKTLGTKLSTLVYPFNLEQISKQIRDPELPNVMSNASCTTNCAVTMTEWISRYRAAVESLLHEKYELSDKVRVSDPAFIGATTVHGPTNTQAITDMLSKVDAKNRSASGILPTSTGLSSAINQLGEFDEARRAFWSADENPFPSALTAFAMRVNSSASLVYAPTVMSLEGLGKRDAAKLADRQDEFSVDLMRLSKEVALEIEADPVFAGVAQYVSGRDATTSEVVVGSPAGALFDGQISQVLYQPDQNLIATLFAGWYDNVWGYTAQMERVLNRIAWDLIGDDPNQPLLHERNELRAEDDVWTRSELRSDESSDDEILDTLKELGFVETGETFNPDNRRVLYMGWDSELSPSWVDRMHLTEERFRNRSQGTRNMIHIRIPYMNLDRAPRSMAQASQSAFQNAEDRLWTLYGTMIGFKQDRVRTQAVPFAFVDPVDLKIIKDLRSRDDLDEAAYGRIMNLIQSRESTKDLSDDAMRDLLRFASIRNTVRKMILTQVPEKFQDKAVGIAKKLLPNSYVAVRYTSEYANVHEFSAWLEALHEADVRKEHGRNHKVVFTFLKKGRVYNSKAHNGPIQLHDQIYDLLAGREVYGEKLPFKVNFYDFNEVDESGELVVPRDDRGNEIEPNLDQITVINLASLSRELFDRLQANADTGVVAGDLGTAFGLALSKEGLGPTFFMQPHPHSANAMASEIKFILENKLADRLDQETRTALEAILGNLLLQEIGQTQEAERKRDSIKAAMRLSFESKTAADTHRYVFGQVIERGNMLEYLKKVGREIDNAEGSRQLQVFKEIRDGVNTRPSRLNDFNLSEPLELRRIQPVVNFAEAITGFGDALRAFQLSTIFKDTVLQIDDVDPNDLRKGISKLKTASSDIESHQFVYFKKDGTPIMLNYRSELRSAKTLNVVPNIVFSKFSQDPNFDDTDREFYAFLPPEGKVSITLKIGGTSIQAKILRADGSFSDSTQKIESFKRRANEEYLDQTIERMMGESGRTYDEIHEELKNEIFEKMSEQITGLLEKAFKEEGLTLDEVYKIGVSSPGPFALGGIDGSGTFASHTPNLPIEAGVSLQKELATRIGNKIFDRVLKDENVSREQAKEQILLRTEVMHDGAAGGLGELSEIGTLPASQGVENLAYFIWGTGIGGGLFVWDDMSQSMKLFPGGEEVDYLLGEVGHHGVWFPETESFNRVSVWVKGQQHHLSGEYFSEFRDFEDRLSGPHLAVRYGKEDASQLNEEEALEVGREFGQMLGAYAKDIYAQYGIQLKNIIVGSGVSHLGVKYPGIVNAVREGASEELQRPIEQELGFIHAMNNRLDAELEALTEDGEGAQTQLQKFQNHLEARYGVLYAQHYMAGFLQAKEIESEENPNFFASARQELRTSTIRPFDVGEYEDAIVPFIDLLEKFVIKGVGRAGLERRYLDAQQPERAGRAFSEYRHAVAKIDLIFKQQLRELYSERSLSSLDEAEYRKLLEGFVEKLKSLDPSQSNEFFGMNQQDFYQQNYNLGMEFAYDAASLEVIGQRPLPLKGRVLNQTSRSLVNNVSVSGRNEAFLAKYKKFADALKDTDAYKNGKVLLHWDGVDMYDYGVHLTFISSGEIESLGDSVFAKFDEELGQQNPYEVEFKGAFISPLDGRVNLYGYDKDARVRDFRSKVKGTKVLPLISVGIATVINELTLDEAKEWKAVVADFQDIDFGQVIVDELSLVDHHNDLLLGAKAVSQYRLNQRYELRIDNNSAYFILEQLNDDVLNQIDPDEVSAIREAVREGDYDAAEATIAVLLTPLSLDQRPAIKAIYDHLVSIQASLVDLKNREWKSEEELVSLVLKQLSAEILIQIDPDEVMDVRSAVIGRDYDVAEANVSIWIIPFSGGDDPSIQALHNHIVAIHKNLEILSKRAELRIAMDSTGAMAKMISPSLHDFILAEVNNEALFRYLPVEFQDVVDAINRLDYHLARTLVDASLYVHWGELPAEILQNLSLVKNYLDRAVSEQGRSELRIAPAEKELTLVSIKTYELILHQANKQIFKEAIPEEISTIVERIQALDFRMATVFVNQILSRYEEGPVKEELKILNGYLQKGLDGGNKAVPLKSSTNKNSLFLKSVINILAEDIVAKEINADKVNEIIHLLQGGQYNLAQAIIQKILARSDQGEGKSIKPEAYNFLVRANNIIAFMQIPPSNESRSELRREWKAPIDPVEIRRRVRAGKAVDVYYPMDVQLHDDGNAFGEVAAQKIIDKVREFPDAVIILPTGSTPGGMYRALIQRFEEDKSIDFSQVRFFNLDEYLDLEEGHPLSYQVFMEKKLYEHLDAIDPKRAPLIENRNIPSVTHMTRFAGYQRNEDTENYDGLRLAYEKRLQSAIALTGRKVADLSFLGAGGAYPIEDVENGGFLKDNAGEYILHGFHIGFNEPGAEVDSRTSIIPLTPKTRKDTGFRFGNVARRKDYNGQWKSVVPMRAISMGVANILESHEIVLMANGEEKSIVLERAYKKSQPDPNFPGSYLMYHPNVTWLMDYDAASRLPHVKRPWTVQNQVDFQWNEVTMRQAVMETLKENPNKDLTSLSIRDLLNMGISRYAIQKQGGLKRIKEDVASFLNPYINVADNLLPQNEDVVIFSPHPDDDVITSGVTMKKLQDRGNNLHVVYLVGGANAVRESLPAFEKEYNALRTIWKEENDNARLTPTENAKLKQEAKFRVRMIEAQNAAGTAGVPKSNLHFLDLPYYFARGFVDQNPIHPVNDTMKVVNLLNTINAGGRKLNLFYSAEQDPHGAHGIGAEVVRQALQSSAIKITDDVQVWGYRGAYEEWPLQNPENLVVVPFGEELMELKKKAILEHASQVNPLFPSFDPREFWERVWDRNGGTGDLLQQMGYATEIDNAFAEIFKKFSIDEFLGRSELRNVSYEKAEKAKMTSQEFFNLIVYARYQFSADKKNDQRHAAYVKFIQGNDLLGADTSAERKQVRADLYQAVQVLDADALKKYARDYGKYLEAEKNKVIHFETGARGNLADLGSLVQNVKVTQQIEVVEIEAFLSDENVPAIVMTKFLEGLGFELTNDSQYYKRMRVRSELRIATSPDIEMHQQSREQLKDLFARLQPYLGNHESRRWVAFHVTQGIYVTLPEDIDSELRDELIDFIRYDLFHFDGVEVSTELDSPAALDLSIIHPSAFETTDKAEDHLYAVLANLNGQENTYIHELLIASSEEDAQQLEERIRIEMKRFSDQAQFWNFDERYQLEVVLERDLNRRINKIASEKYDQMRGMIAANNPADFARQHIAFSSDSQTLLNSLVTNIEWLVQNDLDDRAAVQAVRQQKALWLASGVDAELIRKLTDISSINRIISAANDLVSKGELDKAVQLWNEMLSKRHIHRSA